MAFFQRAAFSFIYDFHDGSRIFFQHMPDDISDSKQANYTDYPIIGRSVPLKGYNNSASRVITLTLQFYSMPIEGEPFPDPYVISKWVDKLRSFTYPDYSRGGILPPHSFLLCIGGFITMKAVMTQYNVTYPANTIWTPGLLLPYGSRVALTMAEVEDTPPSTEEVSGVRYGF